MKKPFLYADDWYKREQMALEAQRKREQCLDIVKDVARVIAFLCVFPGLWLLVGYLCSITFP